MQFKLQKSELKQALTNLSKSVATKSSIKALEGVLVTISQGQAQLTAYDLLEGITTYIACESMDEGKFIVEPRLLSNMINKLSTEDIEFTVDDSVMNIQSGKTKFSLNVQSAEEYPNLPDIENSKRIVIPQDTLKSMISQTIYAVATNDTKPILTGELFELADNTLNLVAIDGYRLALRTETLQADDVKIVIPSTALKKISELLSDKECEMLISNKHVTFTIGNYIFFTRLLEGEFHNYKQSIATKNSTEIIVESKLLIDSLERCILLINDRIKSPVRCVFENGQAQISLQTQIGKINDVVPIELIGGTLEIGFNAKYLLEALKATGGGKIKLLLDTPNKPMTIQGDDYTMLVLPVRLKND